MKKANIILTHIHALPQFKMLQNHYCYQKLISTLPPRFKKAVAFLYVKDDTLFVALSHPGFKIELHYNKDLFRDLLSMVAMADEKCKEITASKVVLFNSKHLSIIRKEEIISTIPYYKERSKGNFQIESKDSDMIAVFNKIRESIKKQL